MYAGTIESLNFPNDYQNDELCEWIILAPYVPHGKVSYCASLHYIINVIRLVNTVKPA